MSEADRTGPQSDDSHESGDDESGGIFTRLKNLFGRAGDPQDFSIELDDRQREAARRLPRARREMIERVIAFDEKRVEDVMAPRADIVAVDIETPLDELIKAFADAGHSRMPVYRGDLDDPVGMAHIKDVVAVIADPAAAGPGDGPILKKLRRDVLYVPPSMRITDLLLRMQASRIHMAIVIDEFGGTDGLVTIEDLVEEIVGDINDE
ncbi:MAG: CBS domain-containing protein, partial [Parvularculaceae bacterium]|nr:CBS domain-containing protein [Parvularculaceae bacterium]